MRPSLARVALSLLLSVPAFAAPPAVPDQVSYAGSVPGGGAGPVDLTVRIYDAASSGTLLYVQDFADVALAGGAFELTLGPTGRATDAPDDPLTTSLVTALAGDLAATAPSRFVEVTVDADPPLPRTQVLASAFALRAAVAENAESADSVSQVGGLPPEVLAQIYLHTNLDGGGPPNADPAEGQGDVDGDGILNFVDADNDGDGLSDVLEISQGSGINLVTPTITGFSPTFLLFGTQGTVQIQGTGFEPGMSVLFGAQAPAPTNVTPTSCDVVVGPQTGLATVTVTRLNGQSGSGQFDFKEAPIATHSTSPVAGAALDYDVTGTQRGLIGRGGPYGVDTDGDSDIDTDFFGGMGAVYATAWSPLGRVAAALPPGMSYRVDTDGDFDIAAGFSSASIDPSATVKHAALTFDSAGRPVIGYLKTGTGTQAMLARDLNHDGDFVDAGELVQIQTFSGTIVRRSEIALDASDRVAYAYQIAPSNLLRIAYDRNGDGDFLDTIGGTPEVSNVSSGSVNTDCLGLSFDSAGRLVLAHQIPTGPIRLSRDQNGDGDVNDAGEATDLAPTGAVCDVDRSAEGGLVFVYGGAGLTRLVDENDDGDFADAGESLALLLPATAVSAVEIATEHWIATETQILAAP